MTVKHLNISNKPFLGVKPRTKLLLNKCSSTKPFFYPPKAILVEATIPSFLLS
ncbi:hypothetical protein MTR_5g069645 [Medicago truncatula]|uniref:Uncharacterized protein n=1 Tax=Medicago truncatula TaxID=3880 RepID=A0A072UEE7_MEDTR|nr:hypothetical protein MTR_5g069645 [Medicago truncatula]